MDVSIKTDQLVTAVQDWLASAHGVAMAQPITLDTSAFTAGTHYPDGFFKSGLVLGKITATGIYGPYDNALANGQEVAAGFLLDAPKAPSVNTIDVQGALHWHGSVILAKLPIALDAPGQADLAAKFRLV